MTYNSLYDHLNADNYIFQDQKVTSVFAFDHQYRIQSILQNDSNQHN